MDDFSPEQSSTPLRLTGSFSGPPKKPIDILSAVSTIPSRHEVEGSKEDPGSVRSSTPLTESVRCLPAKVVLPTSAGAQTDACFCWQTTWAIVSRAHDQQISIGGHSQESQTRYGLRLRLDKKRQACAQTDGIFFQITQKDIDILNVVAAARRARSRRIEG